MKRALPLVALAFLGCGDPLVPPQQIDSTRVLGARVEVRAEPARATPRPGEEARARWLVAQPQPRPLSWRFELCPAAPFDFGLPDCASDPFAVFERTGGQEPTFDFTTPAEDALGDATELLAFGAICTDGPVDPSVEWPEVACRGDDAGGTSVMLLALLATGDETNANPDLSDDALTLDGSAWFEDASGGDCTNAGNPGLPRVVTGGEHQIALTVVGGDRETISNPQVAEADREALELSHFTTGGELDRAFSFVDAVDERAEPTVEVTWTAPAEVDASAERVDFFFVSRDSRGGTDWSARSLCVVP